MNLMPTMSPTDSGGAYWKSVLIESGLTRPNPKPATDTTSRKDANPSASAAPESATPPRSSALRS